MKQVVSRGFNMTQVEAAFLESQIAHHYYITSQDAREGLVAFSEKRDPKFVGR
jgi:enoyl-CoA hydratase/carnithine racemase